MFCDEADFVVVGTGISGLSFALKASRLGRVVVVTKKTKVEGATNLAQGGIAAVISDTDSLLAHERDTLAAGGGLCHPEVVKMVVASGMECVKELLDLGVRFVGSSSGVGVRGLSLAKEGGHSSRRIAHAYDLTGREIERALLEAVSLNENIEVKENLMAIDLVMDVKSRCVGVLLCDAEEGCFGFVAATSSVLLCSGGVGKVYLYTTNPDIATGDGVAMAYRAGAIVSNMEFMQFHPTCLYHERAKNFLISEAVRGEGGLLLTKNGQRFMEKYDPRAELATRDLVARAIDNELKESGDNCVYLDISFKGKDFLSERFPHIYETCLRYGIDISREAIPVVPAAHYMCGGVQTDLFGRTNIAGLYVLGECACTGLHGANRLASNSLLEGVVFAQQAFVSLKKEKKVKVKKHDILQKVVEQKLQNLHKGTGKNAEGILVSHNWDQIRRLMWDYVGIVRSVERLTLVKERLQHISAEVNGYWESRKKTTDLAELRNICLVAELITSCALVRKESRGLHYLKDYPQSRDEFCHDTILFPEK